MHSSSNHHDSRDCKFSCTAIPSNEADTCIEFASPCLSILLSEAHAVFLFHFDRRRSGCIPPLSCSARDRLAGAESTTTPGRLQRRIIGSTSCDSLAARGRDFNSQVQGFVVDGSKNTDSNYNNNNSGTALAVQTHRQDGLGSS